MEIIPNQLIKDGGERYEPGRTYEVDDATGTYFVRSGWADAEGVETSEVTAGDVAVVNLQPDSARHTTTSREG
jgi:hypothetical protein